MGYFTYNTAFWLILKSGVWLHGAYIFTFPQENNWLELIAVSLSGIHCNIYHSLFYDSTHWYRVLVFILLLMLLIFLKRKLKYFLPPFNQKCGTKRPRMLFKKTVFQEKHFRKIGGGIFTYRSKGSSLDLYIHQL